MLPNLVQRVSPMGQLTSQHHPSTSSDPHTQHRQSDTSFDPHSPLFGALWPQPHQLQPTLRLPTTSHIPLHEQSPVPGSASSSNMMRTQQERAWSESETNLSAARDLLLDRSFTPFPPSSAATSASSSQQSHTQTTATRYQMMSSQSTTGQGAGSSIGVDVIRQDTRPISPSRKHPRLWDAQIQRHRAVQGASLAPPALPYVVPPWR